jgi:hypothetical protein
MSTNKNGSRTSRSVPSTRRFQRKSAQLIACAFAVLVAHACTDVSAPRLAAPSRAALSEAVPTPIDTTRTFFGPLPLHTTGVPVIYAETISTIGFIAPFTLHVRNGNVDGTAPASSATISLDGVVMMSPADFKKHKLDYSFPITPGTTTILQVQMAGTDSGYVTVWLDAKEHARFCPSATGDGLGYQSLQTAIDTVTPGHTIWVCDGTHVVNEAVVNKPLTLRAENAGMATLTQAPTAVLGDAILDVNGTSIGKDAIVDLALQFIFAGLHARGTFDSVSVIRTSFTGSATVPCAGTGLITDATTVATAYVSISHSNFANSCNGIASNLPVDIDTYNSTFTKIGSFGMLYSSGTSPSAPSPTGVPMMRTGRIVGNTFTNCGVSACIALESVGVDTISQNQIIMTAGHANDGIFVNRAGEAAALIQPVIITNNVITGRPLTGPDSTPASWAYNGAIVESLDNAGTADVIQGNRISGAYAAISSRSGSVFTLSDNKIDSNYVGVFISSGSHIVANRNDFSNYTYPVVGGVLITIGQPVLGAPPLPAASFTCNWWGSGGGPVNMFSGVPLSAYAPYSAARIAGKPGVTCDPTAVAMTVRACATTNNSGIPTLPTIAAAYNAVPSGGTVLICNGSFVATLDILKPVTITAEGPGMPTIDAGGALVSFGVGHVAGGAVTISHLRFTGGVVGQVILNAPSTTKDGATTNIIGNEFHPPHEVGQPGPDWGIYLSNMDSSTVNVDSNTFIGGDQGISGAQIPGVVVNVAANTFTGQTYHAIFTANADVSAVYSVTGNIFTDCSSGAACVMSFSRMSIVNNTFTAHIGNPFLNAINISLQNGDLTPFVITNNTITGNGHHSTDRTAPATYPIQDAAISVTSGVATVVGNHITNAFEGIASINAANITATDNVITTTFAPLTGGGGGAGIFTANWNDFSDYITGVGNPTQLNLGALNVQLNWWGQVSGPTQIDPVIGSAAYTPFATAPVAGVARGGAAAPPAAPPQP